MQYSACNHHQALDVLSACFMEVQANGKPDLVMALAINGICLLVYSRLANRDRRNLRLTCKALQTQVSGACNITEAMQSHCTSTTEPMSLGRWTTASSQWDGTWCLHQQQRLKYGPGGCGRLG
jgi:hypothetical protein